jgi:hypothetical protein
MAQPVKLSDNLILDARLTSEATERSIAGQIEFWAGLGRAVESLLHLDQVLALRRSGRLRPLSRLVAEVDAPAGRNRLSAYLASRPFPHYEAAPQGRGLLVRIDEDGTRTVGRFVNREFKAVRRRRA